MLKSLVSIICLFLSLQCMAKDLGVWGQVYPIAEQDIRVFIYQKLQKMQQDGKLEQTRRQFIENVKKHTLRPAPVIRLTTTSHPKTFYYDPTFVLQRDIKDAAGKVLIPKGTTVNPLSKVRLHKVLFFLDADDKKQIDWALMQSKKYDYVKYILIRGNIKDTSKKLNSRVYFDQYGIITRKLNIQHIPCIVKQKGSLLEIREFSVHKNE